jgi:hypothetical protein
MHHTLILSHYDEYVTVTLKYAHAHTLLKYIHTHGACIGSDAEGYSEYADIPAEVLRLYAHNNIIWARCSQLRQVFYYAAKKNQKSRSFSNICTKKAGHFLIYALGVWHEQLRICT